MNKIDTIDIRGKIFSRRDFMKAFAAGAVVAGIGLPLTGEAAGRKTVKIGILAPFTGDAAGWGLPGLYGLQVHAKQLNEAGGVKVGGERYNIEIVSYDDEYKGTKAVQGYQDLVGKGVKAIMMLGGDDWPAVKRYSNHYKMLTTTLLPSDLAPDTHYLIAPCEVHPIYNVTGVEYMHRKYPNIKTASIGGQNDSLGLPSFATYEAAFEVAGIKINKENVYDPSTTDFAPIISSLISSKPDCVSTDTSYPDFVNLMCQQLDFQKYMGQKIGCTCDNYDKIAAKTSTEYMKGFIFQFPDFDDPKMKEPQINFDEPNKFWDLYQAAHPGTWNAVSWEYPSILDVWKWGAEKANSIEPEVVLKTMLASDTVPHIWGNANWFGKELWGINHAVVGNWPVVQLEVIDGKCKARIQEFASVIDWWHKHGPILVEKMRARNLLFNQRA